MSISLLFLVVTKFSVTYHKNIESYQNAICYYSKLPECDRDKPYRILCLFVSTQPNAFAGSFEVDSFEYTKHLLSNSETYAPKPLRSSLVSVPLPESRIPQ
ncbi:hypothetical protein T492DRAFT_848477 [Pavlovales sp. CCMP2436]|nr:hypothetical protein T492DRAFT_848477 [Pavlovales sp. CCMP2436]